MKITKTQFAKYVNAVADLGESLKKDITKDGMVSDKTILALNELAIISNEIADFSEEMNKNGRRSH